MTAPYASGGKGRVTPEAEIATKVKSPSVTSIRSPVRWRPTTGRVFNCPHVVKCVFISIKLRIAPMRFQLISAAICLIRAIGKVNLRIIVRATIGRRVNRCATGTGNIINRFMRNAVVVNPAFDDLHTLQRGAQRVTCRPHQKIRLLVFAD